MSQIKIAAAVVTPLPPGLVWLPAEGQNLGQRRSMPALHLGWWRPHIWPQGRAELSWAEPHVVDPDPLQFVCALSCCLCSLSLYESVLLLSQRGSLTSIPSLSHYNRPPAVFGLATLIFIWQESIFIHSVPIHNRGYRSLEQFQTFASLPY